jgi:hypothetical protein
VEAQSFYSIKRGRNVALSVGTGTAMYTGELVNPKSVGQVRYNLVVGAEYYFIPSRLSVRAEAVWYRIAGSDENANSDRNERNLSFFSNNQEISLTGAFYILPEKTAYYQRLPVNFYVWGGIGMLHFNPKAKYQGKNYALQPLRTENVDYSRFHVVLPYGLGMRLMVTPLLNVQIEGGYRNTFTDYLDDVSSRRYVDPTLLSSDLSRALADRRRELDPDYPASHTVGVRGNPKTNDGYFLMNVKLQYYIPKELFGNSKYNKAYRNKRKSFNPSRRR